MKDFDAIKQLWKEQSYAHLNYERIIDNLSNNRKKYAKKLILQSIIVIATLVLILAIWLFKPFSTWTTHLSMLILCFCLIYFLVIQYRDYKKVNQFDRHLLKPEDFISYLQAYKKESYLLNKRNYFIYALGIGTAFLLILLELYFILSFWSLLIFSVFAIVWFLLSYRYLLKTYIKSENKRIDDMIKKLDNIKKQFKL